MENGKLIIESGVKQMIYEQMFPKILFGQKFFGGEDF